MTQLAHGSTKLIQIWGSAGVGQWGPGPCGGLGGHGNVIANHMLGTHDRFSLSY